MAIEKRIFANSEKARAAIEELLSQGFSDVTASYKPDRVRIAVNAPFGKGQQVAQVLDSHGPVASDEEGWANDAKESSTAAQGAKSGSVTDWAAPLSSIFGWKVLSDYRSPLWPEALVADPAPLSTWLGWPVLCGASRRTAPRREAVAAPDKADASPG